MADTDNWRTDPGDFADFAAHAGFFIPTAPTGIVGVRPAIAAVDLDPCSNEGSQIPCRVSLCGDGSRGPLCTLDYSVVAQTPVSIGGSLVNADGLGGPWPGDLSVWCNPPYSDPAPWVVQIVLHALQGGRGCGVLPCNMLETAWGQALLIACGARRYVLGEPAETSGHALTAALHALFTARGVPMHLSRLLQAVLTAINEGRPFLGTFGLYIPSRRLGFIDPAGEYQGSNRTGIMALAWGFPVEDPRTGIHSIIWNRRARPQGAKASWPRLRNT